MIMSKETYHNLLPLPDHIVKQIFLYDPTYKNIFNVVLHEMNIWHRQRDELKDLLVNQELERNIFELTSCAYIATL